jgi:hypothetical protein
MRFLRIKIDVATQGFHEAVRERVRENLKDIFCKLPPRRLWMYLKCCRIMSLGTPETLDKRFATNFEMMDGPEDVIVKGKYLPQRYDLDY